jgi:hypothetical protein
MCVVIAHSKFEGNRLGPGPHQATHRQRHPAVRAQFPQPGCVAGAGDLCRKGHGDRAAHGACGVGAEAEMA